MTAVYAHRGAHAAVRENTLEALRAAVDLGADGVEFDVRVSADGALIVHHDPLVEGRPLSELTLDELPPWVPTLAQALDATRSVAAHVELKGTWGSEPTGPSVRRVLEEIERADLARAPVISSFDLATCARVRAEAAPVRVAWLVERGPLDGALTRAHVLGLHALNPPGALVDRTGVAHAHGLGLDLNVWTVNDGAELDRLFELAVAGVITDDVTLALARRGRVRPRR